MKLDVHSAPWLFAPGLQAVFDALAAAGGEARVAGGAVRNALTGHPVGEVDLATTLEPPEVTGALEAAGIKAVPTGIDHGTVTAVSDGEAYEITTLREDVETDGRRAVVRFGTDWEQDARRRDLTINALYCDREGQVIDPLGVGDDIAARNVRFIGDAAERIREDFLRILRFFRFFAWYGHGRPDADGLKAIARLKAGLERVSAERIWAEFRKLLSAPDPGRALLWMRQTGVLTEIMPESAKWGIDLIPALIAGESENNWTPDPILRLAAMMRPDAANARKLAGRLRLSNAERDRLAAWALAELPEDPADETALKAALYHGDAVAIGDRLRLAAAAAIGKDDTSSARKLVDAAMLAATWPKPAFPLSGSDLKRHGMAEGRELGRALKRLERDWVDSGFSLSAEALLARL